MATDFSKYGSPIQSPSAVPRQSTPSSSIWDSIVGATKSGAERVKSGLELAVTSPTGEGGVNESAFNLPLGLTRAAAGVTEIATAPIAPLFQKVGEALQPVVEKISETKPFKEYGERMVFASPETMGLGEKAAEGIANISEIAGFITGLKGGTKAAAKVNKPLPPKPPSEFGTFFNKLRPQNREQAIDSLTAAYKDSFIENRQIINVKLDKIAKSASRKDGPVTSDDLIRNLASEGYIPEIEGRLGRFNNVVDDISNRQQKLMENIDPLLETIPEQTTLEALKSQAASVLRHKAPSQELTSSLSELDRFFTSFQEKFGESLNAKQVNQIRKDMNARTKAFGEETFKQDTADAVADATRSRLDEIVPSPTVHEANAEWARLNQLKNTARVFHNQQIDVGILGRALGSYAGTIAASGLGLSVAGPGGLVIAGIAAHYGGDAFANFLRKLKFNDRLTQMIIQQVRSDDVLTQKLIQEASEANKGYLERLLLPEGSIQLGPQQGESGIKIFPAPKGDVGRIPKGQKKGGQFFGTFKSSIE